MKFLNKLETQKLLISLETISSYAYSSGGNAEALKGHIKNLGVTLTHAAETGTFIAPILTSNLPYQLARFAGLAVSNGHTQFAEFISETAHHLIPLTE